MKTFRSIVITGASSGIGEGLALDYARAGVRLALGGRDEARLRAVADACRARGADVAAQAIDVADRERMAAWLREQDAAKPVDLVLANAGISIEKGKGQGIDEERTRRTFAVNVEGTFNTVFPLLDAMRARRFGQIGIVASLAGFIGLPRAAAYNASKSAVRVWGESIRHQLRRDNVGVSVICPGFVESRITVGNDFPMPFMMSAARASAIIRHGLAHDRARIAFPLGTKAAIWLGATLPGNATDRLLRRFSR
ncbi:MAG: SDR family NAD(P)-dependent oxidoreductase [Alphaproteobacteria bacterium]|nr:SDR family NAD(P)-dependent oxidoreductase [Alphaproteobacteria bacterium]MCW5739919.1 SDR family NAD(P)-dependent oxidoreductase [Alphaproteobacteria bacterium]